jgi:hypothetical protein
MVERKDCPGERLNVRMLLMHATARFPVVFHVHPRASQCWSGRIASRARGEV